jgi:hypothetical protein
LTPPHIPTYFLGRSFRREFEAIFPFGRGRNRTRKKKLQHREHRGHKERKKYSFFVQDGQVSAFAVLSFSVPSMLRPLNFLTSPRPSENQVTMVGYSFVATATSTANATNSIRKSLPSPKDVLLPMIIKVRRAST